MRKFINFFSQAFGFTLINQTRMAATRFFPNTTIETSESSDDTISLPDENLKHAILSISQRIQINFEPSDAHAEDGLYLGTTGVAYMYYHLSKIPALFEHHKTFLSKAIDYIKPAINVSYKYANRRNDVPSFILGNCGVYAVAAAIFDAIGEKDQSYHYRKLYYDAANTCKEMRFLSCGSDELFVGRAGYICGSLWLAEQTNTPLQKQDLHEICRVMINSGREYSQRHRSDSPLMYSYYKVEYLGAGHGLCMILQALLSVPEYLDGNPIDARDVKSSVDYLLSLQDSEGNFPCATDEIRQGNNELIHWCHGAGGVVYLMAKAYLLWHEDKYLKSCEKAADLIWQKGLLKKGPGLCHGVAGNGYVFLLLYRLTNDIKYLKRAIAFSQFIETEEFKQGARVPDNPFSLYEGIAGTACFLSDILNPSKAAFPFSDVF